MPKREKRRGLGLFLCGLVFQLRDFDLFGNLGQVENVDG